MRMRWLGAILLAAFCSIPSHAVTGHESYTVADLFIDNSRPCAFFRLNDVATADPVAPGNPWFSLPRSHPAFAELFAILMTARAGNMQVKVITTGNLSCGHPEVREVWLR